MSKVKQVQCSNVVEFAGPFNEADALEKHFDLADEVEAGNIEPALTTSFHEAAHAVLAIGFGMRVTLIIAGNECGFAIVIDDGHGYDDRNVMLLSGQFAGGMAIRQQYRPRDAEINEAIDVAFASPVSRSDRSKVIRNLRDLLGRDASNEMIVNAYRRAEVRTLELLERLDIRAAIREVATELMKTGVLAGEEATTIASRHIVPGSISEKEKSE